MSNNKDDLLNLARGKFPKLAPEEYEVLTKLLESVADGVLADFSSADKPQNDPASAANWPVTRTLKTEWIVWLCTDPKAAALVTHKGVQIIGARFDGDLDLGFSKIPFKLVFASCSLNGLNFKQAEIRNLYLHGSHSKSINADGAKIEGDVFLNNGFKAEGEVRLLGCYIGGDVVCCGGQFSNPKGDALSADRMRVAGSVFLNKNFKAEGGVRLLVCSINGSLYCNGGQFCNPKGSALSADSMKVEGSVFFDENFKAEGEVRLLGCGIDESLNCSGGQFCNPDGNAFLADRMKVAGSVFMKSNFKAEGEVHLLGCSIGSNLECDGGQFSNPKGNALSADSMKVEGNIFLRDDFKAEGQVRLLGCSVGGVVDCSRGQFRNPQGDALSANRIKIEGSVFLRKGFKAEGRVSFVSANVGQYFHWRELDVPEKVKLDLRSAHVGTLLDDSASWPTEGNLWLNGFVYERIERQAPLDAKSRKKWLGLQPKQDFLPQPYEQLAGVLRQMGHEAEAVEIQIVKNVERRRHIKLFHRGWLWSHIFGPVIGYGYRPWRAFLISIFIIALGAGLFGIGNENGLITPTNKDAFEKNNGVLKLSKNYPVFSPIVYSAEMFVPLVKLHVADAYLPNANVVGNIAITKNFSLRYTGRVLRWYLWVHIMLGWVLTTLWVSGLTGIAKR